MNCEEFKDHVMEYIAHQIDPELKERMEDHYFECDECFDELELMNATMHELADLGLEGIKEWKTAEGKVKWLISEAQEYLDDGNRDGAMLHYKKAQEIMPEDSRVKELIGSLERQKHTDRLSDFTMKEILHGIQQAQVNLNAGKIKGAIAGCIYAEDAIDSIPDIGAILQSIDIDKPAVPFTGSEAEWKHQMGGHRGKARKSDELIELIEKDKDSYKKWVQEMIEFLMQAVTKLKEKK